MSYYVVGIDPSLTRTGIVVLGGASAAPRSVAPDVVSEGAIQIPATLYRPHRLSELREAVDAVLQRYKPTVIAMEAEVWMASVAQGSDQAAVQAILQERIYSRVFGLLNRPRFLSVNTSQVKKYVGAKQKDQMLKEVFRRYAFDTPDHNIADAYVIARIAWDLAVGSPKLTQPQLEVLTKLQESGFVWEKRTAASTPAPKKGRPKK